MVAAVGLVAGLWVCPGSVGDRVGAGVGSASLWLLDVPSLTEDELVLGMAVETDVRSAVGDAVGMVVGLCVSPSTVGVRLGLSVGNDVGVAVGAAVGCAVGAAVGDGVDVVADADEAGVGVRVVSVLVSVE